MAIRHCELFENCINCVFQICFHCIVPMRNLGLLLGTKEQKSDNLLTTYQRSIHLVLNCAEQCNCLKGGKLLDM